MIALSDTYTHTHTHTHTYILSVRLLWTRDRPFPETSKQIPHVKFFVVEMNFEARNYYHYPSLSFGGKIRRHSKYEVGHKRKQVSHDQEKR